MEVSVWYIWKLLITVYLLITGTLPHRHKIVIAGNHELTFDETILPMTGPIKETSHLSQKKLEVSRDYLKQKKLNHISKLLRNCTFLHDNETAVYGLRVYGSPWYGYDMYICQSMYSPGDSLYKDNTCTR